MKYFVSAWNWVRREPWTFLMAACLTAVMAASWAAPKPAGVPETFSEVGRLETTRRIESIAEGLMQEPGSRLVIGSVVLVLGALVLLGGIWGTAWLQSYRRGERWMERFGSPRLLWGASEAIKAMVLLFFLDLVFSSALGFIFSYFKLGSLNLALMTGSFLRSVFVLAFLGRLIRRLGGDWKDLGWNFLRGWTQSFWGLAGYLAMIPVYAAMLGLLMTVLSLLKIQPPVQTPVQVLYTEPNAAALLGFAVFVGVLGPWFEEIFFRGFLYPVFKARTGMWRGALITSVIFAALHGHGIAFVPILVLGLALNLLYERSGSVVPGAVLHMTHNCLMLAATFWIKGAAQ
jgi:membrane protease YdiL (CAAX protease family)